MTGVVVVAIVLAVIVVAGVVLWQQSLGEKRARGLREDVQGLLAAQAQGFSTQVGQLSQSLTQQLGQVQQDLQQGISATGSLATAAQREVARQLRGSQETLERVKQQLGELQQTERELSAMSQELQQVLGGPKTRGTLGEVALEGLLEDALPRGAFERQYSFSTGAIVDAVVHVGEKLLSVDSKFPLDAYRRILEKGDEALREFAQAVRKHADSIAEKYILPQENTLDVALMFVPSESVYYQLLLTEDSKGRLEEYCRSKRVVPVSPNTFYAYLHVIRMGLEGMQLARHAEQLRGLLNGVKKQLDDFADVYETLGTHLRNAQKNYLEADARLQSARSAVDQVARGALPGTGPGALEQPGEPSAAGRMEEKGKAS
jgi:DNA recombination protein RmuC